MYKPVQDRLVVKMLGPEETKSSLIIPDMAKQGRREGVVVEIGPGQVTPKGLMPIKDISIGDTVLLPRNCGMMLDDEHKLVKYTEIMGVLRQ